MRNEAQIARIFLILLLAETAFAANVRLHLMNCLQSSTVVGGVCSRAIDGSSQQRWERGTCTHTNPEKGWWQARTGRLAHIRQVRIYNRMDCCSDRLNDFVITVDGHECASYKSSGFFSVQTFSCNRVGQVVGVRNRKVSPLTLCEVQVFGETVKLPALGNKLKMSSCFQSSTAAGGICSRAIDNYKNPDWPGQSCTHTNPELGWWQATLKERSHVRHVRIYNRLDCCSDRLNDFSITVDGQECASYKSNGFFSVKTFRCDKVGQLIRINNRKHSPLTLCEVEVYGEPVKMELGNQLQLIACLQSSTAAGGVCQRAFDGNTNQNWAAGTCTHTNTEKGWWQAVIKQFARVNYVRIYNRLDCCSDRLDDFSILLDDQECESYKSNSFFSVKTFKCNKVGQMLMIKNRINTPLTFCEVQVFGDYITGNPYRTLLPLTSCQQSSTAAGGVCSRAIDGSGHQLWSHGSCTHTNTERGWWQARTKSVAHIRKVRIFNRMDCCSDRLNDFIITVDGHECASYKSSGFFSIRNFKCDRIGQVVSVRNRKNSPLTLCEVQVFGEEIKVPSLGTQLPLKTCAQSSTAVGGVCSRAIDGNFAPDWPSKSCTHTNPELGWWQATLKERSHVRHVRIYNRLDCCSDRLNDFSITVDGQECASYKSNGFFSVKTFRCDKVGQLIRINNRKHSPLTLCEVAVFGQNAKAIKVGKYLGCFIESTEWPDFASLESSSGSMTSQKCNCQCAKRGTSVFALRNGRECRCGDNYGSNGEAEKTQCRLPCSGEKDEICGGRMHNAVFEVEKQHC